MINVLFHIVCLLVLWGCTSGDQKTIDDQEMVDILIDMHIAEAAILTMPKDSVEYKRRQYMIKIGQIYDIEPHQIEQQIALLQSKPERLSRIYKVVVDSLTSQRESYIKKSK